MPIRPTPNIATIPAGHNFLSILADTIWKRAAGDPLQLSDYTILLPTRRSCRALRHCFARYGQATLLPRMTPLGGFDDEDDGFLPPLDTLPEAIHPLRRIMLLTRLLRAKDPLLPIEQATEQARTLARFLDEIHIERADISRLPRLVEDREVAQHWEITVQFLSVLTDVWPQVLSAEGALDPAYRRDILMQRQAARWMEAPPSNPIIAAGSTGTHKGTADILKAIAHAPQGLVILPGLDVHMDEETWQVLPDSHPQRRMKNLIDHIGITRTAVQIWPKNDDAHEKIDPLADPTYPLTALMREVMRPSAVADKWYDLRTSSTKNSALSKAMAASLRSRQRIDLSHPEEEAKTIALILREALETPGKTAMLVTPDRDLSMRVIETLRRWDIRIDDTGGVPLITLPITAFMNHILTAALDNDDGNERLDPHAVLALLKHPLCRSGMNDKQRSECLNRWENTIFRCDGPRPPYPKDLLDYLSPLSPLQDKALHPLSYWIDQHITIATHFAQKTISSPQPLFTGESGEAIATWLSSWREAAHDYPPMSNQDYAQLFRIFTGEERYRPHNSSSSRLMILGPMEARLLHADIVILGGLNEGVWPAEAAVDPWMSRPMKRAFGLPSPEHAIGLAAHDFVQLASQPNVIMTRSMRRGTSPTVPSRFLMMMDVIKNALDGSLNQDLTDYQPTPPSYSALARILDTPQHTNPMQPPEPCPAVHLRPKGLSVTRIGLWMRNPYAIYAEKILRLKKLPELKAAPDARERGILFHSIIESYSRHHAHESLSTLIPTLHHIATEQFALYGLDTPTQKLWWPRFVRAADQFYLFEEQRRMEGLSPLPHGQGTEAMGTITLDDFTLYGRADRIDRDREGGLSILDYKTGTVPSKKSVLAGEEPQLPLLALIAQQGGFSTIPISHTIHSLLYVSMGGGPLKVVLIDNAIDTLITEAREGLRKLITDYHNPTMPYRVLPRPSFAPLYDDYQHLARRAEWGRLAGEDMESEDSL